MRAARTKATQHFKTESFFNKALLKADYFKFGSIAFEQQLISLEFFQSGAQAGCYLHKGYPPMLELILPPQRLLVLIQINAAGGG